MILLSMGLSSLPAIRRARSEALFEYLQRWKQDVQANELLPVAAQLAACIMATTPTQDLTRFVPIQATT